jgi:hypothetical protein
MPEENGKDPNTGGDTTPNQQGPADEKNNGNQEGVTSQKNEGNQDNESEKVEINKDEYEKLKKKSQDFDGIIEKQRIEKLSKKEIKPSENKGDENVSEEKIAEIVKSQVDQKMAEVNKVIYEDNLKVAYKEFVKENPWADSDDIIGKISDKFSSDGSLSASQLRIKLERTAEDLYPEQVRKAREDRIKSQLNVNNQQITAGDISGGASDKGNENNDKKEPKKVFFPKTTPIQDWYKK